MTMWFNGARPIMTMSVTNSCVPRSTPSRFRMRRAILLHEVFEKTYHSLVVPDARESSKRPAREGNTPSKLHLVSTEKKEPSFPQTALSLCLRQRVRVDNT